MGYWGKRMPWYQRMGPYVPAMLAGSALLMYKMVEWSRTGLDISWSSAARNREQKNVRPMEPLPGEKIPVRPAEAE
eukprot:CAMPEP_0204360126 /NCGR_PEP_ID=MMETSP0469-20131031/37800_1 /ASSEMBLY_ACC=CAM_ASM_000384 /TAXON_ID=2969 /ORGANISM="Oxyrrhis marina" /LENGTH=75 /DNA_ID=CAMNT_0051348291 /DNA_START=29 /DNA_END=256 /DNA_ORIENTATION=-